MTAFLRPKRTAGTAGRGMAPVATPAASVVLATAALMVAFASSGSAQAGQPQQMPPVMIPLRMPGDPPVTLPALAGASGLPLQWEVATGPATVSGTVVTLTGQTGPVTLRATQPGNGDWDPLTGYVSFAVTEEGGYTQLSLGGGGNSANRLALGRNGRIYGWNFQLASGDIPGPVRSEAGVRWKSISAGGGYQAIAIREDGSLWIWRDQFPGKTKNAAGNAAPPTRVGTDNDWRVVAAGRESRMAIKENGSLWGWWDKLYAPPTLPSLLDGRQDWEEMSISDQDYAIARRVGGQCYLPYSHTTGGFLEPFRTGSWRTATISQAGITRVRDDGTLWLNYGADTLASADTDWIATASLRTRYMALRADGSVWAGILPSQSPVPTPPPQRITTDQKMIALSAGYEQGGAIAEDGSIWIRMYFETFPPSRKTPAFFPQRLDFMEGREQPFPVESGTVLPIPDSALNSRLPLQVSVVSGPAQVSGGGLQFTGPGLVEVRFQQAGDNTWAAFDERRTFLSGPAGPEIAVHDGPSTTSPARQDAGAVVPLGKHTRAVAMAGLVRTWMLENTGALPLELAAVVPEPVAAAGPLAFTTDFTPVTLAPGASTPLVLTFSSATYGSHGMTVVIQNNDADEGSYRIPISVELANTPPTASAGPDRLAHAGSALLLDAAFFSRDGEQAAGALSYHWDLDGQGYVVSGAVREIVLPNPGDHLLAKLRVTDGDGATSFAQCVITAMAPGVAIPPAMRLQANDYGEFSFHVPAGRRYRIFSSLDLRYWQRVDATVVPTPPPLTPGPDGFVHAKFQFVGWKRQYFRAQEVSE